ncbi:unnamed protein product [Gulo gulo]|uniref:Uncharacterized protein n=1 Tax=Gulo gulo TaxID=48420 RepID=A0A9X9PZK3_GULGU|nr:unnamed protein product [Gulo gulo]
MPSNTCVGHCGPQWLRFGSPPSLGVDPTPGHHCPSADPAGWGDFKTAASPWSSGPASVVGVLEAQHPSLLSRADGPVRPARALRAPALLSAPDNPHLLSEAGFPHSPTPCLSLGQLTWGSLPMAMYTEL